MLVEPETHHIQHGFFVLLSGLRQFKSAVLSENHGNTAECCPISSHRLPPNVLSQLFGPELSGLHLHRYTRSRLGLSREKRLLLPETMVLVGGNIKHQIQERFRSWRCTSHHRSNRPWCRINRMSYEVGNIVTKKSAIGEGKSANQMAFITSSRNNRGG